MINIDKLHSDLKSGVATVTFTKINGDVRVMRCTLKEDMLPVVEHTQESRKFSDEATRVYDLDKQAWRSFRNDSVKDWTT